MKNTKNKKLQPFIHVKEECKKYHTIDYLICAYNVEFEYSNIYVIY